MHLQRVLDTERHLQSPTRLSRGDSVHPTRSLRGTSIAYPNRRRIYREGRWFEHQLTYLMPTTYRLRHPPNMRPGPRSCP